MLSNLSENTEIDLSINNHNWDIPKDGQLADTMYLPLNFTSDRGIGLSIAEYGIDDKPGLMLLREKNIPEFSFQHILVDIPVSKLNPESKKRSIKKSIHIYTHK